MDNNQESIFYVYAWYYKDTNKVFYIGKGKNDRYKSMQRRNSYFINIVNKEQDNVDVRFIKTDLNEEDAFSLERQLIKEYKEKGECKANFHEGGCGGNTGNYDSPERSRKLSEAAKKRIGELNPMYGKTHTDEVKAYLREINQGKQLTEEHRLKLIAANTGRKKSEAEIQSIKERMRGRKMKKESYELMMDNLCDFEYQIWFNDELIKTLSIVDSSKDKYPAYNKNSFEDLLFEIQEIVPLENRIEQISEDLKYANTIEEKNKYILDAIALKKLIADKKAKRVGGK